MAIFANNDETSGRTNRIICCKVKGKYSILFRAFAAVEFGLRKQLALHSLSIRKGRNIFGRERQKKCCVVFGIGKTLFKRKTICKVTSRYQAILFIF
jgi:hypothetical protein